jgi:Fic family protein
MKYITVKDAADMWKMSERMVRKYCEQDRIDGAIHAGNVWVIPAKAKRPSEMKGVEIPLTAFAKRVVYQRSKNNHYGIYEYIQVNLAYSSNRMASNRLTRNEVEEVYRTNKITTSFEPVKIDDLIETINHFSAVRYVVDTILTPLSRTYIKKLHEILTYGTYAERKEKLLSGEFRNEADKFGVPALEIDSALTKLIDEYEKNPVNMDRIVDFHAEFEIIHPFSDYNGRVGRLIIIKECLRHGIDPFIIDDKHRGAYNRGICNWTSDRSQLTKVALDAQKRFQGKMALCNLFQYARYPSIE